LHGALGGEAWFKQQQRAFYDEQSLCLSPFVRFMAGRRAVVRVKLLRRYLREGRVLEVGPGMGDVLALAAVCGFRAEGVEHSPVLAQRIREETGLTVYEGMFEEMDLDKGGYDAWLSYHVIEHVPDPLAHLVKAASLVRVGGYAFVATPHAQSWEHRLTGSRSPNYSTAHTWLFRRSGWQPAEVRTFSDVDGWARVVTTGLRSLHSLRGGGGTAPAHGEYARNIPRRLGPAMMRIAEIATWPLRKVQSVCRGGSELFIVARKLGESVAVS
jgi:SAM-dependent methyltransferase